MSDFSPSKDSQARADMTSMVDVRQQPEWELLRRQIYARAIQLQTGVSFDFREMLTEARYLEMAGRMLWQLIKPFAPEVLVGPGFGAAPLLFSTAFAALHDGITLNVLMVRGQRKDHEKMKWVEGRLQPEHSRAVILDDFLNSGATLALVEEALEADGHVLDIQCAAIFFDMWQLHGSRQISVTKYPVVSVFKRHDIGLSRDCYDARPPDMKGSYPDFLQKRLWWRYELNSDPNHSYKSTPVIADGAVFAADDQSRVWRHDAQDGAIVWRYDSLESPPKGIVQLLQYADRSLVFGCYDGSLTRLDATTGKPFWRWRLDSHIHATPELDLDHHRLFINTEQWNEGSPRGRLQAIDWNTGRTLWAHSHHYWPPGSPIYDIQSNTVLATCNDQTLVCVDADTGAQWWVVSTDGLVRGKPVLLNGRAYLSTESGVLHCIDVSTGASIWKRRYGKGAGHQFLTIHNDCIMVLDGVWHLIAFDVHTGEIRWLSRLRSTGCWCPMPYGRYLVVLSRGGEIAVFDPALERKVWEDKIGGHFRQPPAVGNGLLAAASNNDGLKVFQINPFYDQ